MYKKTKSHYLSLLMVLVFFIHLIAWLLIGEIDLLNVGWFISPKTDSNRNSYISPNVFYVLVGILVFSFLILLFGKYLIRKINFDAISFICAGTNIGWMLFITGLIPYTNSNQLWIIVARLVIILVTTLLIFFIANKLVIKLFKNQFDYLSIKQAYLEEVEIQNKYKVEKTSDQKPEIIEI